MIQVRQIDLERDYAMLAEWWAGHGAPVVPKGLLPKLGWCAQIDGRDVAAVWMDMSNNRGAAVLLWWVTVPDLWPVRAFEAMMGLTEHAEQVAASLGYGGLLAVAPEKGGLVPFLERMGFDGGAKVPHVHLVKFLPLRNDPKT